MSQRETVTVNEKRDEVDSTAIHHIEHKLPGTCSNNSKKGTGQNDAKDPYFVPTDANATK